jgi:hypothetical protein
MVRNSRKRESNGEHIRSETKESIQDDVDALFQLPLAEFTGARNALAAQLKQRGRSNDANLVKALTKPSISAWAVNQIYWKHREAFDELLAAGERFRQAQASGLAGKKADMRGPLNARREALSHLSDLTNALLRDAGHNPTPDTLNRIITTLEAVSAYASLSDGPTPGRFTRDVDPPGFESLVSLMTGAGATKANEMPTRITSSQKASRPPSQTRPGSPASSVQKARQIEETRRARIAEAKVSLQEAKRSLTEARAKAQQLEATQKKATSEANQAEKQLREAEKRFKEASAASKDAAQRARSVAAEAKEAAKVLEDAKRSVERATKELESLFRESPGE